MAFQKYFLSCNLRCDFCPRLRWRYNDQAKSGLKSISEDGKICRLNMLRCSDMENENTNNYVTFIRMKNAKECK